MKRSAFTARAAALLALFAPILVPRPSPAAPVTYAIDPDHSSVEFRIRHMLGKVRGQFNTFAGTIVYDAQKPAASTVSATVDVASVDTNKDRRDSHLRSADFFDVEKYPTMTFTSRSVAWKESTFTVNGDLTLHGVTKPVVLNGAYLGKIDRKTEKGSAQLASFTARGKIDRTDFGLLWNRALDNGTLLGNDVEIELDLEAVYRSEPPAAGSGASGTAK